MSECHKTSKADDEYAADRIDMVGEAAELMYKVKYRIESMATTVKKSADKIVIADVESALIEVLISAENLETSIQSLEDVLDEY